MPRETVTMNCMAVHGCEFCNRLFELERKFENLHTEERLRQRKEKLAPVLETNWNMAEYNFPSV